MMIAGKESGNIVGVRGWRNSLLAKDQKKMSFARGKISAGFSLRQNQNTLTRYVDEGVKKATQTDLVAVFPAGWEA
jgi:hypothetical protein